MSYSVSAPIDRARQIGNGQIRFRNVREIADTFDHLLQQLRETHERAGALDQAAQSVYMHAADLERLARGAPADVPAHALRHAVLLGLFFAETRATRSARDTLWAEAEGWERARDLLLGALGGDGADITSIIADRQGCGR